MATAVGGGSSSVSASQASSSPSSSDVAESAGPWCDVTNELAQACQSLPMGRVAMRDGFTLFDSMNAIELMAPKMDTGMQRVGAQSVEQRLKSGALPLVPASDGALMGVLDRLLESQISFMSGNALMQSLFTCLHVHPAAVQDLFPHAQHFLHIGTGELRDEAQNDEVVLHEILRQSTPVEFRGVVLFVMCISALRLSAQVRETVIHGDIYQDEDFITNTFGLDLADDISVDHHFKLLSSLERLLTVYTKIDASEYTDNTADGQGQNVNKSESRMSVSCAEEILQRVRLNLAFGSAQRHLLVPGLIEFDLARESLAEAKRLISYISENGTSAGKKDTAWEDRVGVQAAFDVNINLALTSLPPRVVPLLSFGETLVRLSALVESLAKVASVTACSDTLTDLYSFMESFSAQEPDVIARSYMVILLYDDQERLLGNHTYSRVIMQDMLNTGVPRDLLDHPETETLVLRCVKPMYDILHMFCLNRARVQRRTKRVMTDWAIVQNDAVHALNEIVYQRRALIKSARQKRQQLAEKNEETEQQQESDASASVSAVSVAAAGDGEADEDDYEDDTLPYLAYWAQEWSIRVMICHATMGFELDLYLTYEMDMMLWYLDFLLQRAMDIRTQLEKFRSESVTQHEEAQVTAAANTLRLANASAAAASQRKSNNDSTMSKSKKRRNKQRKSKDTVGNKNSTADTDKDTAESSIPTLPIPIPSPAAAVPYFRNEFLHREYLRWHIYRQHTRGILRLLAALKRDGQLSDPVFEFTDRSVLFAHRTAPFAVFSEPARLTMDDFKQTFDYMAHSVHDLLTAADTCFVQARKYAAQLLKQGFSLTKAEEEATAAAATKTNVSGVVDDTLLPRVPTGLSMLREVHHRELKRLLKLSVANGITVGQLLQRNKAKVVEKSTSKLELNYAIHSVFPSVKVTHKE